jgi:hypothetical protein
MAGWYHPFLPIRLAEFVRIRSHDGGAAAETRLVIGPWGLATGARQPDGTLQQDYRLVSIVRSMDWFDRQVRPGGMETQPSAPVRLYMMGADVWRDEQEWPLARTCYTSFFLSSGGGANGLEGDGQLSHHVPEADQPPDIFVYDPGDPVPTAGGAMLGPRSGAARQDDIEDRQDVLVYTSAPLETDIEVTGPIRLVLFVGTSAVNTDFTGKLVDVHPDGSAFNISDGILRRAYGTAAAIGNAGREVEVELWPTSILLRAGHRIRLEVSSSNFPRFDRNPNTGEPIATATHFIRSTQRIFHAPDTPSRLILPVIPASDGDRDDQRCR